MPLSICRPAPPASERGFLTARHGRRGCSCRPRAVAIGAAEEPLGELRVRSSADQAGRLMGWAAAWRSEPGRPGAPPGSATCSPSSWWPPASGCLMCSPSWADRGVLRKPQNPPAEQAREPAPQPRHPHGRGHPDPPPPQRRPGLLRPQASRGQDTQRSAPAMLPGPIPDPLAEALAGRLRVIGEPARIKVPDRMRHGPASAQELMDAAGTSQQNVFKHLTRLTEHGLIVTAHPL